MRQSADVARWSFAQCSRLGASRGCGLTEFSLLSLNTFGLPLFLGFGRLARLMRQLNHSPAQILCLQEIQQNAYLPLLARGLPSFRHHAYERNRFAPKGGLYTAGRVSFHDTQFIAYQNRGRMVSLGVADWALNKGVLMSHADIAGQRVTMMNTHLHANYAGNWNDPEHVYAKIQHDQIAHLADMVNAQPRDALVIVCGDFNFPRGTFLYDELLSAAQLLDPLAEDPRPTYRPFRLLPARKWSLPIDFSLVRLPQSGGVEMQADVQHIQDPTRPLPHQRFLTDHNALVLHLKW